MRISLRWLLALPLLAQIVIVTSLTGWLAYRNGQQSIQDVAYRLLAGAGENLQYRIKHYISSPPLVTQRNLDAIHLGKLDPENLNGWATYLFQQSQQFMNVTHIYYGNADGGYVEIRRFDAALVFSVQNRTSEDATMTTHYMNRDGSIGSPIAVDFDDFDPRQRPWYQAAQHFRYPLWSDVYQFEGPRLQQGISFVRPYFDRNQQLIGVVGADFTVTDLETFLDSLTVSPSSTTFLMELNGKIIASSGAAIARESDVTHPPASSSPTSQTLNPSIHNRQAVLEETVSYISTKWDDLSQLSTTQQFKIRFDRVNYWVQVTPLDDEYGLDWIGISVLPESDFTQQIEENQANILLLSMVAMAIATSLSILIAHWINTPILRLGQASQAIGQGQAHQNIPSAPIQELNILVDNFNRMGRDLDQSRSQLTTHVHHLDELVAQRTAALNQQIQWQQLLVQITNQIRRSLDIQFIYQATTEQLGQSLNASRCFLYVLSSPTIPAVAEYRVPEYASVLKLLKVTVQLEQVPFIKQVMASDMAITSTEVYSDLRLQTLWTRCEEFEIKSLVSVRTSYRGEPNGIISLHQCDRQRVWTVDELNLIEAVASQVGIAIAQAQLLEQEQEQRQELVDKNVDLEAAKQAAETANQFKSQFLAHMSHELRTPLNAILGFAQLMQRTLNNDGDRFQRDAASHLKIIQSSGDHLLTLINDVLDMAKIEAGQMEVHSQIFNLPELLQSLEAMFQLKAQSKGLALIFERTSALPDYVEGDDAKIRQILINLLGNAIHFTEIGSITVNVAMNDQLHFTLEDTGPGIPPHQLDHLFDAFYQTDTGLRSQTGTGLGLAICKTYIDMLGGNITVHSTVGQGTIFRFKVAVTVADHDPIQSNLTSQSVVRLAPNQPTYRILVVDDTWTNRHLLVQLLKPLGFDVREAENGRIAVQCWQEWQPHLIWMDMRMPVMDGYEATQQIRAHIRGQAPAIIALTASALEQEKRMILSVGCDDFVRKPIQDNIIFEKLRLHLGVSYIYTDTLQTPDTLITSALHHSASLTPERLAHCSSTWLEQLQEAATLADAEWVTRLIEQLPPTDADIVESLVALLHGFRCDRIQSLAEAAIILCHS